MFVVIHVYCLGGSEMFVVGCILSSQRQGSVCCMMYLQSQGQGSVRCMMYLPSQRQECLLVLFLTICDLKIIDVFILKTNHSPSRNRCLTSLH